MLERTDTPSRRGTSSRVRTSGSPGSQVVRTVCRAIEEAFAARGIDPDPPLS